MQPCLAQPDSPLRARLAAMIIHRPPQIPVLLLMGMAMHELSLESQSLIPAARGESFQFPLNSGQQAPQAQGEGSGQGPHQDQPSQQDPGPRC